MANSSTNLFNLTSFDVTTTAGVGVFVQVAGDTMTGPLVLSGDATQPLNPVTFQQFNLGLVGLTPKGSVEAASDTNINLAAPASALVDGHTLNPNDRFLAQSQTLPIENGIYIFNGVGVPATRDGLLTGDDAFGAYVSVVNGATYAGTFRICISDQAIVDTDDLIWDFQASGAVTGDTTTIYESTPGILSIVPLSITNALVNAAAAIDGTKIDPDFGSQNVITTGTGSFESVQITGAAGAGFVEYNRQNASPSAPADGFKLFSSNSDGLSFIPASGNSAEFRPNLLTGNHIYNLPDANGILALVPGAGFVTSNGTSLSSVATIDLGTDVSGLLDTTMGGTNSTGYTAGSVIFANASQLTEDNANFFYDDANNRLGLGTTSPSFKLQLGGSAGSAYLQRDPLGAYISGSASSPTKLVVETTFGSGVAAELALSSRPSGAMGAFEELGWLSFFGRDDAGNQRRGAYIRGITSGAWTSTSLPTHMDFFTVPSGSTSELLRARLFSSGELYVGNTGSVVSTGTVSVGALTSAKIGLYIRGQSGQTADLLQIQNSTPTTIMSVEADGDLNARSLNANGTAGAGFLQLSDQFIAVTAAASAIKVFSNGGNFAVKTSSPTYTFDHSVLSTNRTFQFIDSDYIIANVPAVVGVVKSSGSDLTSGLVDLVTEIQGTLDIGNGGTGATSIPAGIVTSSGSALSSVTPSGTGLLYWDGSTLSSKFRSVVSNVGLLTTTSNTYSNMTGMSISVPSLGSAILRITVYVVFSSSAGANGAGFRVNGGSGNAFISWQISAGASGNAHYFEYDQLGFATNVVATTSNGTAQQIATATGILTNGTATTYNLQWRSENAGSTITVNGTSAYMLIEQLN